MASTKPILDQDLVALIPAAGFGTRFLPLTKSQPKEMLPVVDKPTIQWVVEEAVASGITDILIVTGRGKRAIEDHFDRSVELELALERSGRTAELERVRAVAELADIHYIRQKEQKGLGDAVLCGARHIGERPFAVMLGDTICIDSEPCTGRLIKVFRERRTPVFSVFKVPPMKTTSFGIVGGKPIGDGLMRVERMVEKPPPEQAPSDLGILGRYLFTSCIFDELRKTAPGVGGEIQLTDAMAACATQHSHDMLAHTYTGQRYDIGNIPDWLAAHTRLSLDSEYGAGYANYLQGLAHD